MMRKPIHDPARYERVWSGHVEPLSGRYAMSP